MKQGNLPKQEYKLISMCMQGVENGIAYSCSDCGRTIFNFAIIKGEMDNKRIKKGLPPYELEYKEFTDKSDGLQYCYIEISANGSYQGHTACIEQNINQCLTD